MIIKKYFCYKNAAFLALNKMLKDSTSRWLYIEEKEQMQKCIGEQKTLKNYQTRRIRIQFDPSSIRHFRLKWPK